MPPVGMVEVKKLPVVNVVWTGLDGGCAEGSTVGLAEEFALRGEAEGSALGAAVTGAAVGGVAHTVVV